MRTLKLIWHILCLFGLWYIVAHIVPVLAANEHDAYWRFVGIGMVVLWAIEDFCIRIIRILDLFS